MCLYPKLIKNRKYTSTKKNGGHVPPLSDERVKLVPVGCGKCIECMKKKARDWQVRLLEEIIHDKTGHFVTLTFSNESLIDLNNKLEKTGNIIENDIATKAVRLFLERWRKKHRRSVKHWLITELGQNNSERIHLHGIIWTDKKEEIEKIWQYGNVWTGDYIGEKTVNYIIKYVHKIDEKHKNYQPKILTSKGIGSGYLKREDYKKNKYKGKETNEAYRTRSGHKMSLPIYYRNKIYSEEEREKLWLNRLDKEERFVMGEKIDVSDGYEEYEKAVNWYRKLNNRLGYGDDSINWDKKLYQSKKNWLKYKTKARKDSDKTP